MVDNKEKFSDLLENSLNVDMRQGAIVKGKVISIDDKFVIVNAGLKSEGVIDVREFYDEQGKLTISVGDEVDLSLLAVENGLGETCLSRQHAQRAVIWNEIEAAKENDTVIEGVILGRVKGGLTVGVSGIKAFLPGSLIDIRPVRDLDILPEGEIIQCKVVKMDQKRNNVVVSRRAVLEAESGGDRDELLSSLEEGMELPGVVKNLTDYGAFVDLGGIDGLLHITDMSWKRIKHPSDMVTVGQDITVKVLSYDKEKTRVSLGIKQLTGDPWNKIATRYNDGDRIFGVVTNIADYGCFVEIEEGIEGLVHMSEMDWTNKNIHPSKIVSLGDKVEVMVLEIDENRRRISLGLKQCIQNPWAEFSSQNQINDVIEGTIKSITDFGMFIGLDGGIDGLVHLTDVSWSESGESAIREYKKGEVIKVVVLSIDSERERISLGIKQLTEDPYQLYLSQHPKGSQVTGSVVSHDAKKVVLSLADGVSGILRRSDFADDEAFDSEQAITAYISYDERRSNGLLLSLTETTPVATDDEPNNLKPEQKKKATKPVTATIGDIMKGKLDDVKKTARTKKKDAEE